MSEKEKSHKNYLFEELLAASFKDDFSGELYAALFQRWGGLNEFEKKFRSLFGEIADLKILSGESPVFDAIGKQNNIIFLSHHSNKKEPSYLRDLVEALMKGNENNKVILLLELDSDFDLNEVIKLANEDTNLFKQFAGFPEILADQYKTVGKLKEKYGERLEAILIDIPSFERFKKTKELLELEGIELDSELAKRINVSEEEFERMSTKQKIEMRVICKLIHQMITNKLFEKIESVKNSENIRDEDKKYIERILQYFDRTDLSRNIKIVENVEKIYNEYKDKDGYNIIFYGGGFHGLEILKELKEVKIPPSQKITVYIPARNAVFAYTVLDHPTSKELAKTDALGEALRR